jgi:hypothetical protein
MKRLLILLALAGCGPSASENYVTQCEVRERLNKEVESQTDVVLMIQSGSMGSKDDLPQAEAELSRRKEMLRKQDSAVTKARESLGL